MIFINARFLTQKLTGVQRFAIEISLRLKEIDPSIIFLSPPNILHTELAKTLDAQVIGQGAGYYWEQVELPRFLKKKCNPVLVSLANIAPFFYKNSVLVVHDICVLRYPAWFSKKFYLAYKLIMPQLLRSAKTILTVSEFSKKEIKDFFKIDREIEVIYNAVDNQYLTPGTDDFVLDNKKYLLAVSSFSPRKNFDRIIEAFIKIEDDLNLVIVGGTYANFPKSKFEIPESKIDKIIFSGYINDSTLKQLYKNAVGLVYPSLYEGFGIPPIEAMKENCPVIVSDNTCFREVCKDAALYVDPYNLDDLKEAMLRLYKDENERKLLIKKGNHVSKLYSWESSARKLYNIISLNKK